MRLPTDEIEQSLSDKYKFIAGIDEAGRGPLAGPVFAAACILNFEKINKLSESKKKLIRNSKKLSVKQREEAYEIVIHNSWYGIGEVDHKIIDEINILHATLLAMRLAVDNLPIVPSFLLVDGKQAIPQVRFSQKTIIDGDNISLSIAAASILAKVSRDRAMLKFHEQYPEYSFDEHMGYGTEKHFQMIVKHGPCPIHRMSFSPFSKKYKNIWSCATAKAKATHSRP
jgi:ribonuclease HII